MQPQAHTNDITDLSLDPFESAITKAFHVDPSNIVRNNNSAYSKHLGSISMKSSSFQVSEANCSFNLYPTHITTNHIKTITTQNEPSGACYRVKISDFGGGVAECVASKQLEPLYFRKKSKDDDMDLLSKENKKEVKENLEADCTEDSLRFVMDEDVLNRSIQRAKKNARFKMHGINADRMLTFTTQENIQCRKTAYSNWAKFIRAYKKKFPAISFDFVMVLEKQKRGALHYHVAVNTFHNVLDMRKLWIKIVGGLGSVNVTKTTKGDVWKRREICAYISKYMTKDIKESPMSKKRFSSSRNIRKPNVTTLFIPIGDDTFRLVCAIIKNITGSEMQHWFEIPSNDCNVTWFSTY